MTRTDSPFQELRLLLAHMVDEFGLGKIVVGLALNYFRPRSRKPETTQILNDHLRRDVGLPPKIDRADEWWTRNY